MKHFVKVAMFTGLAVISAIAAADQKTDTLKAHLSGVIPADKIVSIQPSPVPGLMEVELQGGKMLYSSEDGQYVVDGAMFQLTPAGVVNLTQQRQDQVMKPRRVAELEKIKKSDMLIFSPKGKVKATVYAFTDVDCGYCRKLHSEMQAYNDLGIEVRYLAYPRAGIGSNSYKKMVAVWCSDNPKQAMTDAKAGHPIQMKTCDNPVANEYALGNNLGVRGTPSLFTSDGDMIAGYMPPAQLAQALGID